MKTYKKMFARGHIIRTVAATIAVAAGLSWLAGAAPAAVFNNAVGFSGVQGSNGWSYAAVGFAGAGNLAANQLLGTYDAPNSRWRMDFGGGQIIDINATQQDMQEGNAHFSLRYWTADQGYSKVNVTSTLYATVTAGAFLYYYDALTLSQSTLTGAFSTAGGIAAGGGTQVIPLNATLSNVAAGSRIYFSLQNSGDGLGGFTMQTWNQTIEGFVPEPSAVALLGLGGLLISVKKRFVAKK